MLESVKVPFSGTVKADGTFSIDVQAIALQNFWGMMMASVQQKTPAGTVSGNPLWTLSGGRIPLDFKFGPSVDLGPRLIAPGELITISGTGAIPSAIISGALHGVRSFTQSELLSNSYAPAASSTSVLTSNPRQRLFPNGVTPTPNGPSFTVNAGQSTSFTFTIPSGTVALRILASAAGLAFTYSLAVVGNTTNEQYYGSTPAPGSPQMVPTPTLPFTIPIEVDWDTQVIVSVTGDPTNQTLYYLSALFAPEQPGQAGAAQSVFSPIPALWQAANKQPVAINANIVGAATALIVAAVVGQTIYLFEIELWSDAAAATLINLQDSSGISIATGRNTGAGHIMQMGFHGAAIVQGRGIQLGGLSGPASSNFYGSLTYSQG